METTRKSPTVPSREYDEKWIKETWGWDTPEYFIQTQGRNLRPRIVSSLALADLKPGMRVLDIGCGRGEVVLYCGRLGIHALGVDYSREALEVAEKAKAGHPEQEQEFMHFIRADVKNLRADEPFDRIFLLDLIEHLHDWELREIFRICHGLLKSSGALIIHTLPNKWLYEITYGKLLRLFMPWLPSDPRSEKEKAIHVNEMTIPHLSSILNKSGFASRVWLQQLIVEQARWHQREPLGDRRGRIYGWLSQRFIGGVYRILAKTPLKLLMVNEIFAVAWKGKGSAPVRLPSCLTERFLLYIAGRLSGRR
jgi:2-polyprenyl-3-methyl-5-hydroxy-6-metoxy-1,4-benzoquinol methylase